MLTIIKTIFQLLRDVRNPWVYFLNRLGFAKHGVTYKMRNGFVIHSREYGIDGSALNEVWFDRSYDPNAFGIPFDWANTKAIADVGGHIGTFTLFAAAHAPHAKIVTLEPEPSNFAMLSKNVEANQLQSRIKLLNAGIGNGEPITLYTFPDDRGGNSIYRDKEGGIPVTIKTEPLRELIDLQGGTLDYLKLDCEGAEYEALYTLPDDYFSKITCIGMEYHHFSEDPKHTSEALEKFLHAKGFKIVRHKKSMMFAVKQ